MKFLREQIHVSKSCSHHSNQIPPLLPDQQNSHCLQIIQCRGETLEEEKSKCFPFSPIWGMCCELYVFLLLLRNYALLFYLL